MPSQPPEKDMCIEQETHASLPALQLFLGKRFKKFWTNSDFPLQGTEPALRWLGRCHGHDPRNGILAAREDDLLSGLCARNEPGQVRLGSMDRVCRYSFILARACPLLKKKFA